VPQFKKISPYIRARIVIKNKKIQYFFGLMEFRDKVPLFIAENQLSLSGRNIELCNFK